MLPCLRREGDLEPLLALLPEGAIVAELGVFAGEGTRQFLASPRVQAIYCVDFWTGGYDHDDQAANADMAEAEARFNELIGDPRAHKIRVHTLTAVWLVPDNLDLVYLDADHHYEAVRDDLLAWRSKVKSGGWIGGHDYTDPGHPGVRQAVDEVMGPPDHVFPDSSWLKRVESCPWRLPEPVT